MSIGKRIQEAVRFLAENDLEAALFPLVTAIDATAGKEFPNEKKNQIRNEKWLRKNQGFTTWYLLKGAELLGDIALPNQMKLETCLYKCLRCPTSHEAQLDHRVLLTETPILGATNDGIKFSRRHAEGLILAVICSPTNSQEQCPKNIKCPFFQGDIRINDLWGKEQMVRQRLDVSNNRWI